MVIPREGKGKGKGKGKKGDGKGAERPASRHMVPPPLWLSTNYGMEGGLTFARNDPVFNA